jgi:hypothetical protein
MRSEPITPVRARAGETRRDGAAAKPADPAADAFEASLRRARQGLDDEAEGRDASPDVFPDTVPLPLQAALPVAAPPRVEAPPARWAPQPVLAPDVLTRQLQVQALPDGAGEPGHWQLQITETGLPVQRLDLQRSAAGPLTVLVGATPDALQTQHTAKLRQRLARSGASLAFRGPGTEQEP